MIIGAMARIGIVCDVMIHGMRLLSSVREWTMATASTMPRSVPSAKPPASSDSVTQP